MITRKKLEKRLFERRQDLNRLHLAYVNFNIGDEEYNEKLPKILGKIEELEDILCLTEKK